jgi:hypothetical protein
MANGQDEDFFEPLMQLSGAKIFFYILSILCSTIIVTLG